MTEETCKVSNENNSDTPLEQVTPTFRRSQGVAWNAEIECSPRVLSSWFVYLPRLQCDIECFFFTMHHLRTIEGEDEQIKYFKQATHGVLLLPVDNNQNVFINRLPTCSGKPVFAGQWYCKDDEIAIKTVTEAVDDMCRGRLNPIDQEKDDWVMRFGNNLADMENLRTSYVLPEEDIN